MIFRIGAHRDPAIVEMDIAHVQGGIWSTIEAPDANNAAAEFLSNNIEELFILRDWQLYEVTESLEIRLLDYCLDGLDVAEPSPIIRTRRVE